MNYYQFHIGDFRSGTINMSRHSRWIYRDMMDVYYDSEEPLPLDMDVLCDMLGVSSDDEKEIVRRHLRFKFDMTDAGYTHEVCEKVISEYRAKADVARANGKLGGRPKGKQNKPSGYPLGCEELSYCEQDGTGSQTNHKPLTTNQEPEDQQPCDQQAESPDLLGDDQKVKAAQVHIPYDQILAAFAKRLPSFPQPRKLDPDRRQAVKAIWTKEEDYGTVDFFDRYFGYVAKSDFLMGETGWKSCNFDWIFKPKNFRKIIEGTYHKDESQ